MNFSTQQRWSALTIGVLVLTLQLTVGVTPVSAEGFHFGGVGNCNGCHSIHSASVSGQQLLLSSDASSICLNCHAGLGGVNSPKVFSPDGSAFTPGGDFYWLTRSFSWLDGNSPGNSHGHNIVATDYNLFSDPVLSQAPGGTYPSINLGCTSCHDPHGQVAGGTPGGSQPIVRSGSYGGGSGGGLNGNYRLLGDSHYQPPGGATFQNDAPIARQSSISKFQESDSSHVDYGSGMSEWCGNCHAGIILNEHQIAGSSFEHPAGNGESLEQDIVSVYNSYLRTGDFTGTAVNAYLQFVPFERGTTNIQLLDPHSSQGPDVNSNVMCLSCHRAHASAFSNIGRWDFTADLLVDSHPAIGDVGATVNDVTNSYYGRNIAAEFGNGQRQFCEKCHGAEIPN